MRYYSIKEPFVWLIFAMSEYSGPVKSALCVGTGSFLRWSKAAAANCIRADKLEQISKLRKSG